MTKSLPVDVSPSQGQEPQRDSEGRHGAVLDLQIKPGQVSALVQGSQGSPYTITIKIKPISESIWKQIKVACEGHLV